MNLVHVHYISVTVNDHIRYFDCMHPCINVVDNEILCTVVVATFVVRTDVLQWDAVTITSSSGFSAGHKFSLRHSP